MKKLTKRQTKKIKDQIIIDFIDRHMSKFDKLMNNATKELKKSGNFDNAAGTFDDFVELLKPYSFFIRCPMIIIGLEGLETFYIDKKTKMPVELTNQ